MIEAVLRPVGPYRCARWPPRLWSTPLPDGGYAEAWQRSDGTSSSARPTRQASSGRGSCSRSTTTRRDFHRRFARDPLLGPAARALLGWRPLAARYGRARDAPSDLRAADRVEARTGDRTRRSARVRAERGDAVRAETASRPPASARATSPEPRGRRSHGSAGRSTSSDSASTPRAVVVARSRESAASAVVDRRDRAGRARPLRRRSRRRSRPDQARVRTRGRWVEAGRRPSCSPPTASGKGWRESSSARLVEGLVPGADPDVARRTRLRSRKAPRLWAWPSTNDDRRARRREDRRGADRGASSSEWRAPGDIVATGRRTERLSELHERYGIRRRSPIRTRPRARRWS